jgi:Domain of unknown function (DUF4232)
MDRREIERLLAERNSDVRDARRATLPSDIGEARNLLAQRRRPQRLARAFQLSVVAAALLAAAALSQRLPVGESPSPSPSLEAPAACSAQHLALMLVSWSGSADARVGQVLLLNAGGTTCRWLGIDRVAVRDEGGNLLVELPDGPLTAPRELGAAAGLTFGLTWSNWCGDTPALPLQLTVASNGGFVLGWRFLDADETSPPGCGNAALPSDLAVTDATPWVAERTAQGAPACMASQLLGASLPAVEHAAQVEAELLVVNVGDSGCTLRGHPGVQLSDRNGPLSAADAFEAADDQPVVLAPHGVSGAALAWRSWCGSPPTAPLQLVLDLPGGEGNLLLNGWQPASAPACGGSGGSALEIGAFE